MKKISTNNNSSFTQSLHTDIDKNNATTGYRTLGSLPMDTLIPSKKIIDEIYKQQDIFQKQINELKNHPLLNESNQAKKIDRLEARLDYATSQLEQLQIRTNDEIHQLINNFTEKENNLDESITAYNQSHEKFKQKIDELLPSAVSAGLASSYSIAKNSFNKNIIIYGIATTLLYLTLIAFGWKNIEFYQMRMQSPMLSDVFSRIILQLPFIGLLVWLTAFISSKLNEAIRLQQEYAHKEAIASSYGSFKQQIESINGNRQTELLERLMADLIINVSFNPSKTLDKHSVIKSPLDSGVDLVSKVIESGVKLADKSTPTK